MRRKNMMIAFPYYGGKYSHLAQILPAIERAGPHQHFVDVFGGSAAVILNKAPSPVETYNDLNGEAVNFFRMLRVHRERLITDLALTPFSREEYVEAMNPDQRCITELERARRFYILARMTRNSMPANPHPTRWGMSKTTSRRGVAKAVSAWLSGPSDLWEVADRLAQIQLDRLPAEECVVLYDGPETVFYIDPPYILESRVEGQSYGQFEMDEEGHTKLAAVLNGAKGRIILSGYDCPLMRDLYKGWRAIKGKGRVAPSARCSKSEDKLVRAEVLWANFGPRPVPAEGRVAA